MFGGVVRLVVDKLKIKKEEKEKAVTGGTLYSAGLIAGEGLMGIILAAFAIIPFGGKTLAEAINISSTFSLPQEVSFALYVLLGIVIFRKAKKAIKN